MINKGVLRALSLSLFYTHTYTHTHTHTLEREHHRNVSVMGNKWYPYHQTDKDARPGYNG